jgi:hypothetical protein
MTVNIYALSVPQFPSLEADLTLGKGRQTELPLGTTAGPLLSSPATRTPDHPPEDTEGTGGAGGHLTASAGVAGE